MLAWPSRLKAFQKLGPTYPTLRAFGRAPLSKGWIDSDITSHTMLQVQVNLYQLCKTNTYASKKEYLKVYACLKLAFQSILIVNRS